MGETSAPFGDSAVEALVTVQDWATGRATALVALDQHSRWCVWHAGDTRSALNNTRLDLEFYAF